MRKKDKVKNQRQLNREIKKNDMNVRKFLEISAVKNNYLLTVNNQEQYFLKCSPFNISIMSEVTIENLEDSLSEILSAIPKVEIIGLDGSQSYEDNKIYLNSLAESETNSKIEEIDRNDIRYLDNIKLSMATSRNFYIRINCSANESEAAKTKKINEALQIMRENGFEVELADKKELKKMLSIYLERNVFEENFPDYDGQQYGISPDEANEINLKNFVDLVAPSVINFRKSPNYYILGGTYRSCYAIRNYTTVTEKQHLLKKIGEEAGVTFHIYSNLLNSTERSKAFLQAEKRNKSNYSTSKNMEGKQVGVENLSDLKELIKTAHKSNEKFINCAVFIEMCANTLDELNDLKTKVNGYLSTANITKDPLYTQQRDGFVSVAPFGFNIFQNEFQRVLPASSVANLFPFSYSGKTDKKGIVIGKDVNGSNIIVDFDKRDSNKTNGHIAIFGNSGEGKSYLAKQILTIFRQQRKNIYTLDIDDEYSELTDNLGGTNLDMLAGNYKINPLEPKVIMFDKEDSEVSLPELSKTTQAVLSSHISFVMSFFEVYKPEMTSAQLDVLEILLNKTYKKFGIDSYTDLSAIDSHNFPRLQDLYDTAQNELNSYDRNIQTTDKETLYTKEQLRSTVLAINSICVGRDSHYFNGFTNIPNANFVNFIIKGVLDLKENLKNAIYFNIFSFMQNKFFTEGNTAVLFEEIHEIVKSKVVVEYIRSFIKRGRKKNSDVVLASQNIDDLMLPGIVEYTRPLFSIPTHMFLFYPGKVQVETFKSVTGLSSTEYKLISKSHRGFTFYMCGNEKYHIQVKVPSYKSELFGSAGGR